MAPSIDAITVSAIDKRYASRHGTVNALDAISFTVGEGEFVAVVGPVGLRQVDAAQDPGRAAAVPGGEALLRGTPIAGPRRDIGVVFQSPVLFPWRTVLDNVLLPVDVQGLDREPPRARGARPAQRWSGSTGFEHRYPWELSGGMQQRVAITRALVHDPAHAADGRAVRRARRHDARAHEPRAAAHLDGAAKTVLFITHSIPEAVFLADRVLVMTPRARPAHGRRARRPAPPARARDDEHAGVRRYVKEIRGPVQRERRARRMTTPRNVTLRLLLVLSLLARGKARCGCSRSRPSSCRRPRRWWSRSTAASPAGSTSSTCK